MEFLVTMTTHVPGGTPDGDVQATRSREAVRSGQLAAQGNLLRLWRPPLQPGEWRSLGLFAADDGDSLEALLASMPLRIWRSDEVTPLRSHPNDPGGPTGKTGTPPPEPGRSEFLTTFTVAIPADVSAEAVDAFTQREADRTGELAAEGYLRRLWSLPGQGRAMGLWRAPDPVGLSAALDSLPLSPWLTIETVPLSRHPSDPALAGSSG
jgi:muconolactone delta-isomerase